MKTAARMALANSARVATVAIAMFFLLAIATSRPDRMPMKAAHEPEMSAPPLAGQPR